ncbi:MAG: hypothetical protein JKX67_03305, partial [Colwellia sp.]|nr:hypothetical protein [Colwellia sp.]
MPSAGALMVTDYGSHTARMMELLQQVDQPGTNESLFAIPLKYAEVEEVKQHLTALLGTSEASPPTKARKIRGKKAAPSVAAPSLIVGDSRTRTLLMRASEATYKRALPLIRELDRALESDDTSRMYIYHLQHADAATLAATLGSLGQAAPQSAAPRTRNAASASPAAGAAIAGDVRITADVETNSLLV